MRRPSLAYIALCVLVSCAPAANLESSVRDLIASAGLGKARIAVSVRSCTDLQELVAINDLSPMIPASNMKCFSTGVALVELGPTFSFKTELQLIGNDLVLVGDGDPTTADPETFDQLIMRTPDGVIRDFDEEAILALWTAGAQQADITHINGLRIDDRVFDREFVHPTWKKDQLNKTYSAEVAGINFHANHMIFAPRAGSPRPSWNDHHPKAPWIIAAATNKSTNASGSAGHAPWFAGKAGAAGFEFRGTVKRGTFAPVEVTLHDPPNFLAHVLSDRLASAGIEVNYINRVADFESLPPGRVIGPIIATPIMGVIKRCNEESQNLYAEALLKRTIHAHTGRPGSWKDADETMKTIIRKILGSSAMQLLEGVEFIDGSGLSRENKINASLMTAWLSALANKNFGNAFVDSFAEGGKEGTLKNRFKTPLQNGAKVEAKSGYINGVSCLSGYVTMKNGERLAFSVLINNASNIGKAKTLQERIVKAIAK